MMIIKNAKMDANCQVSYNKNRQTFVFSFGIKKLLILFVAILIAAIVWSMDWEECLKNAEMYIGKQYEYMAFVIKTQFRVLYNRYMADYDMFLEVLGAAFLIGCCLVLLLSLIKAALEGIFIGEKYVMINTYKDNDADIRDYKRAFKNYKRNFAAIFLYQLIVSIPFLLYLPILLLAAEHMFSGLRFYSSDIYYVDAAAWFLISALFIYFGLKAISYVISLVYRMTMFVIVDDDEISALDALRRSRQLTQEYRVKEFVFDISFAGYFLIEFLIKKEVSVIGSTIYDLLVYYPYYGMASVNFYRTLKEIDIGMYEELPPYIDK